MYRAQRNYENVQRMLFDGVGRYDIPEIEPTQFDNAELIGFNYAKSAKNCENKAVHFFLDGYFEMVERLQPTQIIFYGRVPDECKGNIVHIKQFSDKWNEAEVAQW